MIPDLTRDRWTVLALICDREAEALQGLDDATARLIASDLMEISVAIKQANP